MRTGKLRYRAALLLVALVATFVAVPASAEGTFSISGTVTDSLGQPLSLVRIETGYQIVFTDDDGNYHIDFALPGDYYLEFMRGDLLPESRWTTVSLTEPHTTLDVALSYRIGATSSITTISSLPQTVTITATSWAPESSCVWATEGDNKVQLTFVEVLPDTSVRYAGEFTIPEGIVPGWHYIQVTAVDCDTEALRGRGTAYYRYSPSSPPPNEPDTTAPSVEMVIPREGHMSSYDRDLGASPDGSTMVLESVYFRTIVTDNRAVKSVYFELFDSEDRLTWNCTASRRFFNNEYVCDEYIHFFSATTYTFRVTATDTSSNQTISDITFKTNGGPIERERLIEL